MNRYHSMQIVKQKTVEFSFRDTSKPMGVTTYKTVTEVPDVYKGLLPNVEDFKRILEEKE